MATRKTSPDKGKGPNPGVGPRSGDELPENVGMPGPHTAVADTEPPKLNAPAEPAVTPTEPFVVPGDQAEGVRPPEPPVVRSPARTSDPEPQRLPDARDEAAGIVPHYHEPDPAIEPVPAAAAAAPAEEDEEHHEEEAGMTWAARLLLAVVLLVAGAGLGLWAAPRIAPMLPAGLAPAAEWLTPGRTEAAAEIAALQERLETTAAELQSRLAELPSPDDVDGRVSTAVGDLESRLGAEIEAVRSSVAPQDDTELRQRLDRLETAVEGREAELATLKQQLEGTAAAGGQVSQDAINRIDTYRAELEGLRAEMGTLQGQVGALASRIDEVAAAADRQVSAAQSQVDAVQAEAATQLSAATVNADIAQIRAAITAGEPFEEPLQQILSQPGVTVPAALSDVASAGVTTFARLRDEFPDAAHAAIRASIHASAGDGLLARTRAFLEAQVASRSLTPQDGVGTDAVLSRMEDRLRRDDLAGVLEQAEGLPSEAKAAMQGWLDAARQRAEAVEGLSALDPNPAAPAATN
jgi:hypothetical protein